MIALKKVKEELFTKKKNAETERKGLLKTSECPKYKKSSQQLPSCIIAMRDSLFRKIVFAVILL